MRYDLIIIRLWLLLIIIRLWSSWSSLSWCGNCFLLYQDVVKVGKEYEYLHYISIFFYSVKNHTSFQNILSFLDFVYNWYEKIRLEWTKLVKRRHFQKRVSVIYLFITCKVFNISTFGKLSHNLWGNAFLNILSLRLLIHI